MSLHTLPTLDQALLSFPEDVCESELDFDELIAGDEGEEKRESGFGESGVAGMKRL